MADSIGTVVSIATYAWQVYGKYVELGEQGESLANDVRAMAEQLDASQLFLRHHNEKINYSLKQRLLDSSWKSKITLAEADDGVKDLEHFTKRTWWAFFAPDSISGMSAKLQKHRNDLLAINQDIDLMLSGWMAKHMEEADERAKADRQYVKVPLNEIPRDTPLFTQRLLQDGRYIDTRNNEGHTPLHDACKAGHANLVSLLLKKGADPALPTEGSRVNAVHIAALHGQANVLGVIKKHLLKVDGVAVPEANNHVPVMSSNTLEDRKHWRSEKWKELVLSTQVDGQTPLHLAARSGNHYAVRRLLESLGDINRDLAERMAAARRGRSGHTAKAAAPRPRASPADVKDFQGRTPLHLACANSLQRTGGPARDYDQTVMWLLREKMGDADVDMASHPEGEGKGRTALHWAAANAREDIVARLIRADVRKLRPEDNRGHTPSELALRRAKKMAKLDTDEAEMRARDAIQCIKLIDAETSRRRREMEQRGRGRGGPTAVWVVGGDGGGGGAGRSKSRPGLNRRRSVFFAPGTSVMV